MNVVNRIQFPHTDEAFSLYMKYNEGASLNLFAEHPKVVLTKNGVVSLNTYFNSFYESYYAKYTELESLYYLLRLEGDFEVSIYRERYGQENRELIYKDNFENCQLEEQIKISLPESWRSEKAGRVYLEIMCLSEQGSFTQGAIATEENPVREVSLGIISCTYRKEAYIKKTVDTILKDDFLQGKKFKIFVVDNGKTLKKDEFHAQNFELIPNRNLGGSGGFTRGLIQALQEDVYTHFLFMDDDIDLESESIYRLFSLYEYAKGNLCVAGSMLDIYKKNVLFEAGALFNSAFNTERNFHYHPFSVAPLKHKINLDNPANLNNLLLEEEADYGSFWFFAFSKQTVQKIGLPLPLFIKLDDIEFGLRIKEQLGNTIVAFPSFAVWHEPFYAKDAFWERYYWYRNHLITHAMHGSLTYTKAVKFCTKRLIRYLMLFDYSSSAMIIKGFEDYLKGPNFLKTTDSESLHREVLASIKNFHSQNVQLLQETDKQLVNKSTRGNYLQKFMSLVTLNGHLLPNFLVPDDEVKFWVDADNFNPHYDAFLKRRIAIIRDKNTSVYRNELDRKTAVKLLLEWLKVITTSMVKWSSISAKWKSAASDLTSIKFWHNYLQLDKDF